MRPRQYLRPARLPPADEFCKMAASIAVAEPGELKVASVEGANLIVIELSAPPEEVGRLVGRDGRTIAAIRVLADALAQRIGKRVLVDVQPVHRPGMARR